MQLTLNDQRTLRRSAAVMSIASGLLLAVHLFAAPSYDALGTGRRPLVVVNGTTQQLATTDYLTSVGGISTNATAPATGDVQTTTLATGALNTGVIAATITTSQDNWNPTGLQTASLIQVSPSTQLNITGLTAPTGNVAGRRVCIQNTGASGTISLLHQSSSSSAANRFVLVGGQTWQLVSANTGAVCFFYDSTASRWTQIGLFTFPKLNVGSANQFTVATTGATATSTLALSGFANAQSVTASAFSVVDSAAFSLDTTPATSYGVKSDVTTTRSTGTATLTNMAGWFSASGAQVNDALVTGAGDVLLNSTSGSTGFGATPQIVSTGAPTANHGTLGTGSTNWVGNVTSVGAFTSVTLTFSTAFTNRSWCFAQPNATGQHIYVTRSASAPVFNCTDMTGAAANCVDFSYQCVGQ